MVLDEEQAHLLHVDDHPRVLFVDDDALCRSSFARLLRTKGFVVDVASNASEALCMAEQFCYPVVVTDLKMPDVDGIELIRRLHPKTPSTVFVIVTGRSEVEIPADAQLRNHVSSIVVKPFDDDELVDTVRRSVSLHESRSTRPPVFSDRSGRPNTVLLLEDDDSDAGLVEAYLSFSNHKSTLVRSRRLGHALELLEKNSYGVVITDLSLPDARGLDAVIRIQNVASDVPLIVMTGLSDESIAVQAVQAGAQDYLIKGGVDATGLLRSIRYARERKRSEQNLSQLARFDPLTGLANRSQFTERLQHTLSRARRTNEPFAVMFIDLDQFKPVNDKFGHAAGDQLLVEVSRRLEDTVREYDVVARLGGDEFAVVLDNLSDFPLATLIAQRMLEVIRRPYRLDLAEVCITSSIGIAFYPDHGASAAELVRSADRAMYTAKRRGHSCYEVAAALG